jgi:hypothetical protein
MRRLPMPEGVENLRAHKKGFTSRRPRPWNRRAQPEGHTKLRFASGGPLLLVDELFMTRRGRPWAGEDWATVRVDVVADWCGANEI